MATVAPPTAGGKVDGGPPDAAEAGEANAEMGLPPTEICDNGLDDNANGTIDEGCPCMPGAVAACYSGSAATRGRGACRDGVMRCLGASGTEFGAWGPCEGDVLPSAELCDAALVDENCSGEANEGCECNTDSPPLPCGSNVGECRPGAQACVSGRLGPCEGAVGPTTEVCDGLDNDCNGAIDDGLTRPCGSSIGTCRPGVEVCVAGAWEACSGGVGPAAETCNGLDDDCDGMTDEDLFAPCGTDVGACEFGMQECVSGTWGACTGGTDPITETCDGVDNDCNGAIDDGLTRACGSSTGACRPGTEACSGGTWGACAGGVGPTPETCDGLDNDCNGTADDGLTRPCGSSIGACLPGVETCSAGVWGGCAGAVGPAPETCNSIDDDCNGVTDDGLTRSCGSNVGACRYGSQTCSAGVWGTCGGGLPPSMETCNAIDDDCNGVIDDGLARSCGSNVGACRYGTQACSAGVWGTCSGGVSPTLEVCDNVDNDCNGVIDDGLVRSCGSSIGVCRPGTQSCAAGSWGTCTGGISPSPEVCDGVDNNCDGRTDEGCLCVDGTTRSCGSNVGACRYGSQLCTGGAWGTCTGGIGPTAETCNAVDDDCNGLVDDALTRSCGSNVGACRYGAQACSAGVWGTCTGGVSPTTETCNNVDDDCDGVVDDGLTRSCGSNVGACRYGSQMCAAGSWGTCTGGVTPTTETCNNVDDDCDGVVDDGLTRSCGSNVGACRYGSQICSTGIWGTCTGGVSPTAETCNNVDDDCDGVVDDGLTRSCGSNVGACRYGSQTCSAGSWGTCSGGTGPVPEVCDGVDNDCNGLVDDGGVCNRPPVVSCPAPVTATVLSTISLTATASDPDGDALTYQWTVTLRPLGSTSNPSSPTSRTTNFFLDASGAYTLQFCATDTHGATSCCTVSVTSQAPGALHVELTWSTSYGDVDLHLLRPGVASNQWFTVDDDYYANRTPDWPPTGAQNNPTLDIDDTNGYGPENITITDTPATGTFTIGVDYYCQHSIGSGSIDPGSGPTTATVRVYCSGTLAATIGPFDLDRTGRWMTVATVDWPSCTVRSVLRSDEVGNVIDRTIFTSPLPGRFHCEVPCSTDRDCLSSEYCATVSGGGPPHNECVLR